ncbi:MAG: hypothetical protein IPF61_06245 [Xanthomonadales bacterium]|nr:hypothetical protein [Xanthomonadales bacterium]
MNAKLPDDVITAIEQAAHTGLEQSTAHGSALRRAGRVWARLRAVRGPVSTLGIPKAGTGDCGLLARTRHGMSYPGGWRPHIESALNLDLRRMFELGALRVGSDTAGTWQWTRDGAAVSSVGYHATLGRGRVR